MYTHFMLGDWERALASDTDSLRWVTNWTLPLVGRHEEAIEAYRELESRPLPGVIRDLMKASRLVLEGKKDEALALVDDFIDKHFDPEGLYFTARVLARVNEHDAAPRDARSHRRAAASIARQFCCGIRGWIRFAAGRVSPRSSSVPRRERARRRKSFAASTATACLASMPELGNFPRPCGRIRRAAGILNETRELSVIFGSNSGSSFCTGRHHVFMRHRIFAAALLIWLSTLVATAGQRRAGGATPQSSGHFL